MKPTTLLPLATLTTLSLSFGLSSGLTATARADATAAKPAAAGPVTTQACLGDFATFLTCPAGASVSDSECRAKEPHHGAAPGEHWSGSQRQGPAIFFRGGFDEPRTKDSKVSFVATYKNHKKNGRIYRFDKEGRLASWENVIDDKLNGLSVNCNPDGTVAYLAPFANDKVVGVSRSWRKDGSLSYALDHGADGKMTKSLEVGAGLTPELMRRPDELCRPARCEVNAKPDLSGMPKGISLTAAP